MPHDIHSSVDPQTLNNINYGFFTIEQGSSNTSDYRRIVHETHEGTRNVNIFSMNRSEGSPGYDSPDNVASNIEQCLVDLEKQSAPATYRVLMTTQYSPDSKPVMRTITPDSIDEIKQLSGRYMHDKLDAKLCELLEKKQVMVIPGDAVIVAGFNDNSISIGGASGDAHPIILFDDEKSIGAFVSGAHANIRAHVVNETIKQMAQFGADIKRITSIVGPGLGPQAYEFGSDAPQKFEEELHQYMRSVRGEKYLLNMPKIIAHQLIQKGCDEKNIHDMKIDTMGFDLYDPAGRPLSQEQKCTQAQQLLSEGPLFFGARRQAILDGHRDSLYYNKVGRHYAGMFVRSNFAPDNTTISVGIKDADEEHVSLRLRP